MDDDLDDAALAALDAAENAYLTSRPAAPPRDHGAPQPARPVPQSGVTSSAFSAVRAAGPPPLAPLWLPHPALKLPAPGSEAGPSLEPPAANRHGVAHLPPPVPADTLALDEWWYPTNMPVRSYQQSICKTALCQNTLVSIPTGMGKTLIAAVVMYNFRRWFPTGRLAFLAPTKPLIHQQIKAVRKTVSAGG